MKTLNITLTFSVEGHADQEADQALMDHLASEMEMQYRRLSAEGKVTPEDDDFEDTVVTLTSVTADMKNE